MRRVADADGLNQVLSSPAARLPDPGLRNPHDLRRLLRRTLMARAYGCGGGEGAHEPIPVAVGRDSAGCLVAEG